jgi:hypothetical protein
MEIVHKEYLGDGVYALFDGYAILLRANNPNCPTDEICLEPQVIRSLINFNNECISLLKEKGNKQ